jgi:hypothetical protein
MNDLDIKLDRLVDGELSQQEYGSVLSSLENEQDGWKRCALAFLESQALKQELPALVSDASAAATANQVEVSQLSSPVRAERYWPQWLAVAASLFLMFWLGRGSIVPTTDALPAPGAGQVARTEPSGSLPSSRTLPHQGEMTLVLNGADGQSREVELPVLNGEQVDPSEVLAQEIDIPQDLIDALQASGHRIERYRELVPIRLDRERQVVVPVDRVRVVPANRPTF